MRENERQVEWSPLPDVHGLAEVDQPLLRRRDSLLLLELLLDLLGLYGFDDRQVPFYSWVFHSCPRRVAASSTRWSVLPAARGDGVKPKRTHRVARLDVHLNLSGREGSAESEKRGQSPCRVLSSSSSSDRQRRVVDEQRTRSVDHDFARPGEHRDSPPCQSESERVHIACDQLAASEQTDETIGSRKVERPTHLDLDLHRVRSACQGLKLFARVA